ncbi:RNA pseudouridine synthase [Halobacillus halophilus]|uniref:Pseudouridine synthase n=2 Tax=Halobacillus halophilus TaxID=1570 RepID=I0JJD7_HALH3|nr:RluA family pseudouridine synthase [Halobacillus halophilus]ASF38412.1 RNA pseudouridine synthase [Halobacillus halophilus]CCG44255.1 pseudouridine synthase [Halobacillus halophilus DSM 2266]
MKTKRIGEWLEVTIPEKWNGYTIERVMKKEWFVPRKLVHEFRSNKELTLNNETANWKDTRVQANDLLRIRLFKPRQLEVTPVYMDIDVVYEDDHLLVVNKPAGLFTHPNTPDDHHTLVNGVAFYFQMNGIEATPKYVHRLDKDTSGAILFAKHDLAIAMLGKELQDRNIKRTYIAWAHGRLKPKKATIDQPIGKDRHHPVRRRVSPNGQPAITTYEVLEYDKARKASLVTLNLQSGRTHQIRVHMSYLGHPLLGDELYGGEEKNGLSQALHAARLTFIHPFTEKEVRCLAIPPEDSPFFKKEHVEALENL